ncbi:MAG: D-2-hydroxyacid dehydrogenase [Verrucomicrobiales bacterium]|nr:D-2-hydroxyacid dehydrogenase [Verrucomicrobiales bacterium]
MKKPRIVILDIGTLSMTERQRAWLGTMGEVTSYDRSAPSEMYERACDAEMVITTKCPFDAELFDRLPKLKYVGVLGTGYDMIDIAAARERGITVTSVPDYCTAATAQHVFALLLEMTNHAGSLSASVHEGRWSAATDFCFWDEPLEELAGLRLGIIGYGRIGQEVAKIASAFGMEVIIRSREGQGDRDGFTAMNLEKLLESCDVVTLHCPLTSQTSRLLNEERLSLMKKGSRVINAGRGELIDEAALASALESGHIRAAAVDVLSYEPPPESNPLLKAPNCIITPHVAWATTASIGRLIDTTFGNLESFLDGAVVNEAEDFETKPG